MRKRKSTVETETQAQAQAQAQTETQAQAQAQAETQAQAQPQAETQAQPQAETHEQVQAETQTHEDVAKVSTVDTAETGTQLLAQTEESKRPAVEDFTVCIAYGPNGNSMPYEQQLKFVPNISADKTELASHTARAISKAWQSVSEGYFKLLPTISAAFWNESWKSFVGVKSLAQMVMLITGCAQSTASELCKVASVMYDNHGHLLDGYEFFTYSDLIQLAKLDSVIRKAVRQKAEDEIKAGKRLTRVRLRNIITDACMQNFALAPKSFRDKVDKEERRVKKQAVGSTTNQQTGKPDESTTNQQTDKPEESTTDQQTDKPEESTTDQQTGKPDESTTDQQTDKPEESTTDQQTDKPEESTDDSVSAAGNPFVEQISIGAALDDIVHISRDIAGLHDDTEERLIEMFGDDVPQTDRINNTMKLVQALRKLWAGIDEIRAYESVNKTSLK